VALLPDPPYLGLPDKFTTWRTGQDKAVVDLSDSPRRVFALNAPTGFGKTATYVGAAVLNRKRTAFLTSTKGLQSQLMADFSSIGMVDVRGQQNYPCHALQLGGIYYRQGIKPGDRCDAGPCRIGAPCRERRSGCAYFDALKAAQSAQLVTTNYSFWVAQHRYSDGLGKFDMLVLDEAHDAPDELAQALEIEISEYDVETAAGRSFPSGDDPEVWRVWAIPIDQDLGFDVAALEEHIKELNNYGDRIPHALMRELHFKKSVLGKVHVLATMEGAWVIERELHAMKAAPVFPAPYAEEFLFLNIAKIVLVSATVKEKTLELLGVAPAQMEYHEYPSLFPTHRRPVTHVPTVKAHHKWSDVEQRTWVRRIDQVLARRLDRKGIIHTGSYQRRDLILTHTEYRDIMLFNDGTNTRQIVERFRRADAPCVLVSPSLTTGWDLPYDECEYAIIGKVPFPDTRSKITKARDEADKEYGPYCAIQTIVQAAGRGMRSADDQCEILILDDQWMWFWPRYKKFAPQWFINAVAKRRIVTIPEPLPKLQRRSSCPNPKFV